MNVEAYTSDKQAVKLWAKFEFHKMFKFSNIATSLLHRKLISPAQRAFSRVSSNNGIALAAFCDQLSANGIIFPAVKVLIFFFQLFSLFPNLY